mmetsp:Transcript_16832/g.16087  ORF Transcript_16832/g.16087 Transcript_16832/m.16087 type:complete len:96 (-) Transcript_16832:555-842(-)
MGLLALLERLLEGTLPLALVFGGEVSLSKLELLVIERSFRSLPQEVWCGVQSIFLTLPIRTEGALLIERPMNSLWGLMNDGIWLATWIHLGLSRL